MEVGAWVICVSYERFCWGRKYKLLGICNFPQLCFAGLLCFLGILAGGRNIFAKGGVLKLKPLTVFCEVPNRKGGWVAGVVPR